MEVQTSRRKIIFGAGPIDAFLDIGNVQKTRRLLRQGLILGAMKMGRQDALDVEAHVELSRARAGLSVKGAV